MPARPVSRDDDNGCGEWTVPFELRQRGFGVGGGDCKVDKGGTAGASSDDGGGTRQQMASAQHAARAAAAVAALAAAAPVLQRARLMADAEIYARRCPASGEGQAGEADCKISRIKHYGQERIVASGGSRATPESSGPAMLSGGGRPGFAFRHFGPRVLQLPRRRSDLTRWLLSRISALHPLEVECVGVRTWNGRSAGVGKLCELAAPACTVEGQQPTRVTARAADGSCAYGGQDGRARFAAEAATATWASRAAPKRDRSARNVRVEKGVRCCQGGDGAPSARSTEEPYLPRRRTEAGLRLC